MIRRACILFAILLVASSSFAQKRAFTIEDLYRVKNISDLHVSPDGKSIVFLVTTPDLARAKRSAHIWTANIDGSTPRQLTDGEKNESSPSYSPDGKQILFVSSKDGSANLYLMPAAGGEARRLTNLSTGVSDPLWSRDGKWIAVNSDVYPECAGDEACNKRTAERWAAGSLKAHMADELLYRHWTAWKDGTRTHTFVVNATTGEARDLTPGKFDSPTFQLGGPIQYDISPDGTELTGIQFVPHEVWYSVPRSGTNENSPALQCWGSNHLSTVQSVKRTAEITRRSTVRSPD